MLTWWKVVEQLSDIVVEEALPVLAGPGHAILEASWLLVNLENGQKVTRNVQFGVLKETSRM